MKWLFWTAGAFLLGFIVLFLVGNGLIFIVEVPWLVLFGWWSFLQGTLPGSSSGSSRWLYTHCGWSAYRHKTSCRRFQRC